MTVCVGDARATALAQPKATAVSRQPSMLTRRSDIACLLAFLEECTLALAHLCERLCFLQVLGCYCAPVIASAQLRDHRRHTYLDPGHDRVIGRDDVVSHSVGRGAVWGTPAFSPPCHMLRGWDKPLLRP